MIKKIEETFPFDYKQLSESVKETRRRAYDSGLLMSVLNRMAELEVEVEELKREVKEKDNYNKKVIKSLIATVRGFARKFRIAMPALLDHRKERKEFMINEGEVSPLLRKIKKSKEE